MFATFALFSGQVSAEDSGVEKVFAGWSHTAIYDDSGQLFGCSVNKRHPNGFQVGFAVSHSHHVFGFMSRDSWNLTSDEGYPFTYSFDKGEVLQAVALRQKPSRVIFRPEDKEQFLIDFFERSSLEISFNEEIYMVSLPHLQQSLEWFYGCITRFENK